MDIKVWGIRRDMPAPLSTDQMRGRVQASIQFALDEWKKNPEITTAEIMRLLPPALASVAGGETRCIEITAGTDRSIVDMGTGARCLGYEMMARGVKGDFHLILTATTWDRLQGWPFFVPGYIPGNVFHLYTTVNDLEERLIRQQDFSFFPVRFHEMASQKKFDLLSNQDTSILSFRVRAFSGRHADSLRIEQAGQVIAMASPEDAEARPEILEGCALWLVTDAGGVAPRDLEERARRAGVGRVHTLDRGPEEEDAVFDGMALSELDTVTV